MSDKISFLKGTEQGFSQIALPTGRPGVITDPGKEGLILGTPQGNKILPRQKDLDDLNSQMADITDNLKNTFIPLDGFVGINGAGSGTGQGSNALSIRNVRGTPSWATVEATLGSYDFTSFDEQYNLAKQWNEKLYITLGNNNMLYGTDNISKAFLDSTTKEAHLNFVDAVSKRYKNNGYMYSFWNEPNVKDVYHYGNNPEIYVNIIKDMYKTIKANDPTAIVCMPDLATGYDTEWFVKCCELGLLDYTDVISLHIYSGPPELLLDRLKQFRTIIRRFTTANIPIYITEFGWSSAPGIPYQNSNVDEETRAKYVVRYMLLAMYSGIRKAFIYTSRTDRTDETNKEDWFGIYDIDDNWTKLPIANAILDFMDVRYCFIGRELVSGKNDYVMKLMRLDNNTIRYAYWTSADSHDIALSTGDVITLTDAVQVLDTTKKLDVFDILNAKQYDNYSESVKRVSGYNEIFNNLETNLAIGKYAHVEGSNNTAMNSIAHAEGVNTLAGTESHSEGTWSIAYPGLLFNISEYDSTAKTITLDVIDNLSVGAILVIYRTTARPIIAAITAIETENNIVTIDQTPDSNWKKAIWYDIGNISAAHAEGQAALASGNASHASGFNTIANVFASFAGGQYNKILTGNAKTYSATADCFVIGNGNNNATRGNAFRVTFDGNVFGLKAFNSTGADYAEYFEWLDENPNKEDRVGYFVTLDGEKIRKAASEDSYILGIVSATPSVIGDSYQDGWKDKYITDDWGRLQYEEKQIKETKDENGNIISPARIDLVLKINPDWDNTKEYIPREKRPEWSAVGIMGKLPVKDDGTCEANGFCKPNNEGIATKSDTGYKVMKRITENIVLILFK